MIDASRYALPLLLLSLGTSAIVRADGDSCSSPRSISGSCSGLTEQERSGVGQALQKWMTTSSSRISDLSGSIHLSIDGVTTAAFAQGYARATGPQATWARIETDPEKPTLFPIASMTKVFTAALVWKRIEAGLLRPESKISDYIPFLNDAATHTKAARFWEQITVGELLNHTSGIGDHVDSPEWQVAYTEDWDVEKIIAYVQLLPVQSQDGALNIDRYSNAGYTILGRLLEHESLNGGQEVPLAQILQNEIIGPMNLQHTGVLQTNQLDGNVFALPMIGTAPDTDKFLRVPPMFFASGDMYSTAEDLDRWAIQLFVERTYLTGDVTELWSSTPSLWNGRTQGMTVTSAGQYHIVYKTGHLPTYANDLAYVPEYGITIAVLQNGNTIGPPPLDGRAVSRATDLILERTVELTRLAITKRKNSVAVKTTPPLL